MNKEDMDKLLTIIGKTNRSLTDSTYTKPQVKALLLKIVKEMENAGN